jgi:DNA ligase-associated metallophosphoesterase
VADLHLEKGSSFAGRGILLPPFDTAATLKRLAQVIAHHAPRMVIALGDSFHDERGGMRLGASERAALRDLQRGRDWLWIAGNHDPRPTGEIGGQCADMLALGALTFRHAPVVDAQDGEIAGHLHPMARVTVRGHAVGRRCFAADGRRMVLPAFGAYAGGLNIRHHAFAGLFGESLVAHLLGDRRVYAFAASHCFAD